MIRTLYFAVLAPLLSLALAQASYQEAPMLTEQVEAGELPPVAERLPEDPYVVTPIEEVGRYGGTARVGAVGSSQDIGDDMVMTSVFNSLMQPHPETGELELHFAREIEVSDDFSTYTVHFRRGVKWSDGVPFTTEDVMFWYEDVLQNEDLTPSIGQLWQAGEGDELAEVEALDEYTLRISYAAPKPFFRQNMVHDSGWWFHPKHYLSQFHPNYADADELARMTREAGFDHWFQLFGDRNVRWATLSFNPDLPTLGSYRLVEINSERRVYERNPYYWKVDTEGNQLPYIDRIETQLVGDRELLNGRVIAGELDYAGMQTDVRNMPLYLRNQEQGGYRVLLWDKGNSSDVIYQVNQTHRDPGLRQIFQDVRFRRALSLAINREEIAQEVYFGRAQPTQYTVLPISRFYREEYEQAYTEYDLEAAKALLDEMGLETNGEGRRLRPDNGQPIAFTIEFLDIETPKTPNVELVTEYWNELGLSVTARQVSGELQAQRAPANLMDATVWHGDKATDILFPISPQFFVPFATGWEMSWGNGWVHWFGSDGEEGMEPPAHVKELHGWWEDILRSGSQEEIDRLADNILASQAENLWVIGTVGRTPHPVIATNSLRNVPETGYWVWDMLWSSAWSPEQMFFAESE